MKTILAMLIVIGGFAADADSQEVAYSRKKETSSASCTAFITQNVNDDYYGLTDATQTQGFTTVGATTVCEVHLTVIDTGSGATMTVEIWDGISGSGTQLGSTSGSQSVPSGGYTDLTFTFATKPSLAAGTTYYIKPIPSNANVRVRADTVNSGNSYTGGSYNLGGAAVAGGIVDWQFAVWTQ